MSETSGAADVRPTLYEVFDEAGRTWLEGFVRLVNDGAYTEAVNAFRDDEAAIYGDGT